jgi:hypothetical protein
MRKRILLAQFGDDDLLINGLFDKKMPILRSVETINIEFSKLDA